MSNIKVAVRVRPPIEREIKNGKNPIWKTRESTIYMESGKINSIHTFDHVFDSSSTNLEVYQKYFHPIVASVMLGFNGTIFAFGQTASGKTHTMTGSSSQPGLIPLTIDAIFDIIQNMPEREYMVRISYIEIYNENVLDLLGKDYGKHLQIRDNVDGQPVIPDLTEVTVGSKEEIMSLMKNGERCRHVASTEANQRSSRSHAIFRMVIESSLRDGTDGAVAVGQLNLVDLAGSERSEQCGDSGERFRESSRINVSLSFLTQVISKLSRGERGHINFRDSKLTRILRNSLGGNSHTAIVCTVNPCCMEQTLRTLKFASSAKKIQNTPKVNEILTKEALIHRYHMQIEELKDQMKVMEETNLTKALQEKNSQIDELRSKVSSLEKKLLVSTLPQKRKQRRETWAAPRSIGTVPVPQVCTLSQWEPPPPRMMEESPDMERCRLSTVLEESESFHAISHDDFEKQLQREERIRRSAVLHTSDSSNACCSTTCAERIASLENELKTLRKEHKELQELTTLERLMCQTSRRPVSSEKPERVESTASDTPSESMHTCLLHVTPGKADQIASTPLSRMNECCIQTLLASRQQLERGSRTAGAFFSPVVASPPLAEHDESSEASSTSPDCGKTGEHIQGPRLRTPRAVLWTPKHSPAVCMNGTPIGQSKTLGNRKVSEPFCFARATQTDDMPYLQAPPQSIQTEDSCVSQQVQAPAVDAMCQTDSEDAREMPRPVTNKLSENCVAECLVDGSTLVDVGYHAKRFMNSTGVQTTGSCCKILERAPGRPELTDAAISCCLYSEQLVEYGIQTEPYQREFSAMELTKQEALCVPACVSDQVPLEKSCFMQACGVQTCVVTMDSESQVSVSLAEEYRTDFETQTAMPGGTCCGVQAIPDTEDYASQVSTSLVERYRKDFETQTVMPGITCCGVQAIPDVEDYASQVSTSLVEEYRKDFETETVMPGSTCCGVQTIPYVEDYASQVSKSLVEDYRTDCGVQVMAEVLSCASQVDMQLTRKEATDCAVQCELLVQNSERETPASKDCGVQATFLVQECGNTNTTVPSRPHR
ncbi:kinesin-like protein KIF27 isoform X3 [Rhipicephalus sanguineus]|uniref:kinesin-like protein KIF27 isoform X3 n=1 Tax=Rhipicephalus sanguineus TaxID=34632 RepID=UPI0020C4106C|nr:kinesin-like protein KIF27 isoform X3 [Rhipicephalus sanguineus]